MEVFSYSPFIAHIYHLFPCILVFTSIKMDFNFKKMASEAGGFFSRAKQANSKTSGGFSLEQNNQLKCLRDFVEAQMSFFAQSHQMMADLQRELSGSLSDSGIGLYSNSPPAVVRSGPAPITTAGGDLKTLTFRGSSAVLVSTLPAANLAKSVLADKMRLKVVHSRSPRHYESVCAVGWANSDEMVSCSDDHNLLRWNLIDMEATSVANVPSTLFPTSMHWFPRSAPKNTNFETFAMSSSDGKTNT
uniref:WD_REPEATS_REGION domain-containing protein n=1 Tax=Heterorhabditis bacteriophora TaxID=37862 RepID=A0A1I7XIW1_HETBA